MPVLLPAVFPIILDFAMTEKNKTTAEIARLHEHLWIALGPRQSRNRSEALRALAKTQRTAENTFIHKIVDPVEAGVAGGEASKRYRLYKEGQSVADFILRHGDGGHLRLDVQRGCIRLVKKGNAKKAKRSARPAR